MKKSGNINQNLFIASVVLFWFSQYSFVPHFTPYLTGTLAIPAASAGIIVSAYGLLQTCLRIPTGVFGSKSVFSRYIMLLGSLALALSSLLLMFSRSFSILWLARALAGVGAATWVCFTVFYTDNFAASNKRGMGFMVSANNLGMMLGYIAAAAFNDLFGIRFLFAASGVGGLLSALLLIVLFRSIPSPVRAKGASVKDVGAVLTNKRLWVCSILTALSQLISFATMISFSANYAVSIGCSGAQVGSISVINTVAGLLASSTIASGKLDRVPQKLLVSSGFVMMFLYCILLPKCAGFAGLLALQFIGGIGRTFVMTTMMAGAVTGIAPVQKTMAMGVFQSVYGLGMTLGPILMGRLLDGSGNWSSAFLVIAVICVLSALLPFILKSGFDKKA